MSEPTYELLDLYLGRHGVNGLRVLEVGCSFGHMTEHLADQPEVSKLHTFDTDPAFFAALRGALRAAGQPPSLCLPYLNLLFRKV